MERSIRLPSCRVYIFLRDKTAISLRDNTAISLRDNTAIFSATPVSYDSSDQYFSLRVKPPFFLLLPSVKLLLLAKKYTATMAVIFKPPMSLNALTNDAVEEITSLLRVDPSKDSSRETSEWLDRQRRKVERLRNEQLLRPDSVLYRGWIKLFGPDTLCSAHKGLDHRVIRSLLWNIAYESTARTNIYRVLRLKGRLGFDLERPSGMAEEQLKQIEDGEDEVNGKMNQWLDLMNEMSALWLGEKTYRKVCCSTKKKFLPRCVAETGCEACMLAAVGGSCLYLMALRASLTARHECKTDKSKGSKKKADPPPLLRVVDTWISKVLKSKNIPLIIADSDDIAPSLVGMRTLAKRLEKEQLERRKKRGKRPATPWGAAMVTWTEDKLPIPLQHRPREKPVKKDAVSVEWTTELTRSLRATASKNKNKNNNKDKDGDGSSKKTSGAIQTEAESEKKFSSVRDSVDLTQEARRQSAKRTRALINFSECYGDSAETRDLSDHPPSSGRVFTPSIVGPQESVTSWTSEVVDDEEEDDDDIYDEGDRRPAQGRITACDDNDAVKSADGGDNESEVSLPSQPEEYVVSPAGSSVYSCDERDKHGNRDNSDTRNEALAKLKDRRKDKGESEALGKSEVSDGLASCFESMGWGGPKK